MNDALYVKLPGESNDEFLVRLGKLKESHQIGLTWTELALILNGAVSPDLPKTESYWRKRFHAFVSDPDFPQEEASSERDEVKRYFTEVEKQRIRARDERLSYAREVRSQARVDETLDLLWHKFSRYENITPSVRHDTIPDREKAMYVMLSDIHYGLSFHSVAGKYDSDIARDRLCLYAKRIKELGISCSSCYVSLMGDMISGMIHPGIRVENKETLIDQVVGVSMLTADFLYDLASYFDHVYVNSVSGNHSRFDPNPENVLRHERLDSLVPWYCKAKLENVDNIEFVENVIDTSIGSFNIYDHLYVCVHGDMEKDLKASAQNISKLICRHVDYFLSGHKHIAEFRFEDTRFIVNGCVCGSGDDYTVKKRLFGPPVQVCMVCTENGVESVCPIELGGV